MLLTIITACSHFSGPISEYKSLPEISLTFIAEPILDSRIQVLQAGSPALPPVVLIHGLGDEGMNDWKHLIPLLAEHYHVLALDLPGFGASERKNVLYNIDNYADVVKWLMDTHNPAPYHIIGHSLGGAIAMRLAAKYPARVATMILADVAGILYRTTITEYMFRFDEDPGDSITRIFQPFTKGLNMLLRSMAGGFGDIRIQNRLQRILHDPDLRRKYLPAGSNVIAALGLVLDDFSKDLDNIDQPTLIIWSDNDNITPLRTGKLLEHKLKHSNLKIIHDGGHAPMITRPETFNHLVLTALISPPMRSAPLIPLPRISTNPEPAYCLYQDEPVTISGEYGHVTIDHCPNVTLRNLTAQQITINESTVEMDNISVGGSSWGMLVTESIVTIRRSYLSGESFGLLAEESRVQIEQSASQGFWYGAILADSVVDLTGTIISGDNALHVIDSELLATGCDLLGKTAALSTAYPATLMFSVSRLHNNLQDSYLHGPVIVTPEKIR